MEVPVTLSLVTSSPLLRFEFSKQMHLSVDIACDLFDIKLVLPILLYGSELSMEF